MQVDGSLGSLLQGVSQQNKRDRIAGQCTEQVNLLADVARDLVRRPHTEHIANLLTSSASYTYHIHDIGTEQYIVLMSRTSIKVFRLSDGLEQTIATGFGAYTYLNSATDDTIKADITATTIGDYSIIANRQVNTQMFLPLSSNVAGAVVQVVLPGLFSQKYTITIDESTAASYTTPATDTAGFGVLHIAQELYNSLVAGAFNSTYDFNYAGDYIYIVKKDGLVDTDISASSDAGDTAIKVTNNDVRDLSDLPKFHYAGKVVLISGKDNSSDNDYYMKFSGAPNVPGTWSESIAAGLKYQINTYLMPHALVRTTAAYADKFYFGPIDGTTHDDVLLEDWVDRLVGDDDSNELPSFIGSGIEFVSQWQNRLVMLSGPNLLMSKTNSFFNFFNKSAIAIVDDDPIKLVNPATEYTLFRTCLNHNRHLLVFSDDAQFVVRGTNKITPLTASLVMSSAYSSDLSKAHPVAIGASALFPFDQGGYVGLRDYVTGQTLDQNNAESVTEHIKKYIKGSCLQIAGSANHSTVLVRSTDDLNTVYVYQFMYQNNERVQSAWGKWTFLHPVEMMYINDNTVYFVVKVGYSALRLVSMDLGDSPENLPFNIHADYVLHDVTPDVNGWVTYPYASGLQPDDITVISSSSAGYPGMELQVESISGTSVKLKTFYGRVSIGVRYESKYTPTMPQVKDEKGITISTDPLTVLWMLISVADSYEFDFDVTSKYKETTTQVIRTDVLGSFAIGEAVMKSGSYQVSVLEDTNLAEVSIKTSSPYPLNVIDIEYRGQFQKRGARL